MFEIIKKLQSTNPDRIIIQFNDHWTCYQTIEGYVANYQHRYAWIGDRQRKQALREDKVWTVSINWEGRPWEHHSGYNLSDVLGRAAKEEGLRLTATEFVSDMDMLIHRIIGDRSDTYLSMTFDQDHEPEKSDFVTLADRHAAEAGEKLWAVQWYPNTPVGCCLYSSLDLRAALKAMGD